MLLTLYLRIRRPASKYGRAPAPVLTSKKPTTASMKSGEIVMEVKLDIPDEYFEPMPTLRAEVKIPKPAMGLPGINQVIVDEIAKKFSEEMDMTLTISTNVD